MIASLLAFDSVSFVSEKVTFILRSRSPAVSVQTDSLYNGFRRASTFRLAWRGEKPTTDHWVATTTTITDAPLLALHILGAGEESLLQPVASNHCSTCQR